MVMVVVTVVPRPAVVAVVPRAAAVVTVVPWAAAAAGATSAPTRRHQPKRARKNRAARLRIL